MRLRYLPDYVLCLPQRVEAVMGCVVSLARWMTNGRFRSRAVLLAHTPRTDPAAYEGPLLGCPCVFDQGMNAVCMDASELNHALVQAGNSLHQHLRALADGMLASLAQDGVRARAEAIRCTSRWGKERIGEQLGMSGRHQPQAGGRGHPSRACAGLLHDMALQALRAGRVLLRSAKLGFSDENAFSRAFRRWTGFDTGTVCKISAKIAFNAYLVSAGSYQ